MGEKLHPFSGFTASVCQLRPESRGSLRIKSADPAAPPEIRINYLATEIDRTNNVEGMKILRKILAAPALKPYTIEEVDPGAKVTSDEGLLAYLPARGSTIYHPTSTCRMGNDPLAVVDQELRVRGIEGLRVVDASVMPDLMSGNTNAPVIMIAEKASDMILQRGCEVRFAGAAFAFRHEVAYSGPLAAIISRECQRRAGELLIRFESGSAHARAPWRWPRPRKSPGALTAVVPVSASRSSSSKPRAITIRPASCCRMAARAALLSPKSATRSAAGELHAAMHSLKDMPGNEDTPGS